MKHYKTTRHEEALTQITTKLSKQNHSRLTKLKEWLNYKGIVINQQEVLNNLLEHCFSSTETAIQIDEDKFSYVEILNLIEQEEKKGEVIFSLDMDEDEEMITTDKNWILNLIEQEEKKSEVIFSLDMDEDEEAMDSVELFRILKQN